MASYLVYECLKCWTNFYSAPGPTDCPKCGHVYVRCISGKDKSDDRAKEAGDVFPNREALS